MWKTDPLATEQCGRAAALRLSRRLLLRGPVIEVVVA